jgi:hypothetical protein
VLNKPVTALLFKLPTLRTHVTLYYTLCGAYIVYMAEIHDYTEFKLHALMESAASENQYEIADALREVLDGYLLGELHIEWANGFPLVKNVTED